MGKGFENYMSKKWFHPTNIDNMKRVFNAEQRSADEKKRQQDLRQQYEREQELFSSQQLMGNEKARLGLAFMYNAPAGYSKGGDEKSNEVLTLKKGAEESNQSSMSSTDPKQIRCLKCKKWGHLNTDKSCPLYGKSKLEGHHYSIKEEVADEPQASNISSNKNSSKSPKKEKTVNDGDQVSLDMLRGLPKREKKVLLKRLKKLEKKMLVSKLTKRKSS